MRSIVAVVAMVLFGFASAALGQGPELGQQAPPLTIDELLQAPEGASAELEDLRGKVVVVEFWATWCPPCVAAIPHLNQIADELKGEDVVFVAVTAETATQVNRFLKERPIRAWIGLDPDRRTQRAYGVTSIPRTFVISPDGRIAGITRPEEVTAEKLRKVLRGEDVKFDSPESSGIADQPATLPLAEGVIRPSVYEREMRHGHGTGIAFGEGLTAERLIEATFHGERIRIEAPLPAGLYDFRWQAPPDQRDPQAAMRAIANAMLDASWGVVAEEVWEEREVFLLQPGPRTLDLLKPVWTGGMIYPEEKEGWITITCENMLPGHITGLIEDDAGRPVLDETAIGPAARDDEARAVSRYNFSFRYRKRDVESLQAALRESLDLRLVPAKRRIKFIVLRRADD